MMVAVKERDSDWVETETENERERVADYERESVKEKETGQRRQMNTSKDDDDGQTERERVNDHRHRHHFCRNSALVAISRCSVGYSRAIHIKCQSDSSVPDEHDESVGCWTEIYAAEFSPNCRAHQSVE